MKMVVLFVMVKRKLGKLRKLGIFFWKKFIFSFFFEIWKLFFFDF